jgi:glycosyltransferase involved in cell wall biosynthesis
LKRLLMIAFHYPPFQGSSGVLRTWNFSRYLPRCDWQPVVLTASARAYENVQQGGEGTLQIPANVEVLRAFALDTARHLAIRGRYPRWLALPDRWLSWYPAAVLLALRHVRRAKPSVLWSTFPIATAHLVAHTVHRYTGLPWVADFRDVMTEGDYPTDVRQRDAYRGIERHTIRNATAVVFTTEGARRMYRERYPDVCADKFHVIPNGYDEDSFAAAERALQRHTSAPGTKTLLHSGVLYPSERDPKPFLAALGRLKRAGRIRAGTLNIKLRASGHDELIGSLIEQCGVADIVELAPSISYGAALSEMLTVDGLLLLQAANCNHQIPAKLYEYLRAGRPILALTDAAGDTAAVLRSAGIDTLADLADSDDIEAKLPAFIDLVERQSAPRADRTTAARYSRESQAVELAQLLRTVAA